MSEIQGAVYDKSPSVSGNRKAEMALVYLALTADGLCGDLLKRVEPRDFCYDDCRYVFAEVVAMFEAGQPLSDKAAQASWFKRPEVVHRMRQVKLDWFNEDDNPISATEILELVMGGEFASVANLDWYVSEVRKWRVVRGLRILEFDLSKAIDEHEPLKVLEWLEEKINQIKEVATPLLQCQQSQQPAKS